MVPPKGQSASKRKTVANSGNPTTAKSASKRHSSHDGGDRQASSGKSSTSCEKEQVPKDPCYLYKMAVEETWPAPSPATAPAPPRPRSAIRVDLEQCDKDLMLVQDQLEAEHTKWWPSSDKLSSLRSQRDEHQEKMMKLIIEHGAAAAKPTAKRERSKDRAFTVVRHLPPEWLKSLEDAQRRMRAITQEIKALFDQWDQQHAAHESLKGELQSFQKDLDEKLLRIDKAKAALERRRRRTVVYRERARATEEAIQKTSEYNLPKRAWYGRQLGTDRENVSRSERKEAALRAEYSNANADYNRKADSFSAKSDQESEAYVELQTIHDKIKAKKDELKGVEEGVLQIRNTLVSPAKIEVVAGSREPWYHAMTGKRTVDKGGRSKTKDASKSDDTPTITVKLDADNDSGFPVKHPKGYPWGPSKVGQYCKASTPPAHPPGPHPYLTCSITPAKPQEKWPFPVESARGKEIKFEAWQAQQFGSSFLETFWGLNKLRRAIRVISHLLTGTPVTGNYELTALTCGYKPTGRTRNVTGSLRANVVTYPSDSFEFVLQTSAFSGKDYSRESSRSDARKRATGDGPQHGTPSDAADRHQVVTTHTNRSAFGLVSKTEVVTNTTGTVGDEVKSSSTTENIDVDRGKERYRKDGQVDPQRVPAFDSTFFPLCPVDVSFKRNGLEDEFTKDVKACISTVVLVTRELASGAGKLSNFIPSVGWGFKFSFDVLKGDFSYYKQRREHIDARVYPYSKGKVNLTVFSTDFSIYGGVWLDVAFVQFKAVVELELKGSFGLRGEMESTHPDAIIHRNVGFGPTGAVAAKVQIKIVVGNPDWCTAAGGLKTGIEAELIGWAQHTTGPHVSWDATFTGVKTFFTAKMLLVGGWEYERTLMNPSKIASSRFPRRSGENELQAQNESMDRLANAARTEAAANLAEEDRRHRRAMRAGR